MRWLTNAVTVGILAVGAAVGLYFAIAFVTQFDAGGGYRLWALMDDARGLVSRSRVLMAGIPIGAIDALQLEGGKAKVTVRIRPDIVLYCDATAAKEATSLLGEYNISLTPGIDTSCVLKDGDQIVNVIQSTSIDQVVQRAGTMAVDLQRIAEQVSGVVDDVRQISRSAADVFGTPEGQAQLQRTLDNISQVTDAIRELVDDNKEVVGATLGTWERISAQAEPEVGGILDNVRQLTEDLQSLVSEGRDDVGEGLGSVRTSLATLQSALERLDRTLGTVEETVTDVADGQGTVGRLLTDDTLINEVEGFVERANDVVIDAADFVGSLTRLQTLVGLRTEYNFFANSMKTYISLRLQPREDKYYLIEIIDDPRGSTSTIERTTLSTEDPYYLRELETVRTGAFRFSLMMARRLGFATFRFGIKESTGGLGVDLHFLEDALEISMDAFSIGTDVYPRLKLVAALEFLRGLYIVGGADDVLNVDRDFFIGFQLRFNDEDLKAILTFAPSSLFSSGGGG
jgi:phospholipid/cholesterol/gamma-HCH transport system substrate-binding protein